MKIANDNEGISPVLIREVSILRELSHPNIVKYSSTMDNGLLYRLQLCYMDFSEVKLYFEYMDYDLKQYIDAFSGKIDSNTIKTTTKNSSASYQIEVKDLQGRLIESVSFEGLKTVNEYDSYGNLLTTTKQKTIMKQFVPHDLPVK